MHKDRRRIWWCTACGVPLLTSRCEACGAEGRPLTRGPRLRPVFAEEVEVVQRLSGSRFWDEPRDLVLWRSRRTYFLGGRRLATAGVAQGSGGPYLTVHDARLLDALQMGHPAASRTPAETTASIEAANKTALGRLEEQATELLREYHRANQGSPFIVSWSGGKDSAVVADLSDTAVGSQNLTWLFVDTGIELPSTYEHLGLWRGLGAPVMVERAEVDFFEMGRAIGPPSRTLRWCCYSQKCAPFARALERLSAEGRPLVVTGLRRSESSSRASLPDLNTESKVATQVQVNPIVSWTESEVWLRMLARGTPLNPAYRFGLDRVGCSFCPNSSRWRMLLTSTLFPAEWSKWRQWLFECFEASGMRDPAGYVDSSAWTGRKGGIVWGHIMPGAAERVLSLVPCALDPLAVTVKLPAVPDADRAISLLAPLGRLRVERAGEQALRASVDGRLGAAEVELLAWRKQCRVTFRDQVSRKRLAAPIRGQLAKLIACVGCGACLTLCPSSAVELDRDRRMWVRAERCTACGRCVRKLRSGCLAADSLNLPRATREAISAAR